MNCLGYEIPESFQCAGHEITVTLVDKTDKNNYGYWNDIRCEIVLAKNIIDDNGDVIKLSERQVLNSFFHELIHCFEFFYDNGTSEALAQSFANLITEYATTSKA